MKKLMHHAPNSVLAVCLLAMAAVAPVTAQEGGANQAIEVVRHGIPHDALYALEMSGEWGLAVGAFGLMLETNDGGGSWNALPAKTQLGLFGVSRAGDKQMVVGQMGFVMTREGDGEWEPKDSGFQQRLLNVDVNADGMAVTVGEFGFVAVSKDFGSSWNTVTLDWEQFNEEGYEPHLYDAEIQSDGTVLITGEFGLVLRSTDSGATFEAVAKGDQSVFDLHFAQDGSNSGYAVGQEGLVMKTIDNGLSWQRIDVDTNANLLGVWSGNGEVVITGIRQMLRSSDDGASFSTTEDIQIVRTWYQGVAAGVTETQAGAEGFLRQQSVYVVGHQASIARVTQ